MQVLRTAAAALLALTVAGASPSSDRAADTRMLATVRELAALGPRPAGSAAEARAGTIVAGRFRALGYRVVVQPVRLPRGGASRNVVALSPGRIRTVVVAHLDGVADGPAANDNASGVAVVLEVARALRGERGLLLAALGAEERVETGSRVHLGSARLLRGLSAEGRRRIALAVSLDMVGVGSRLHVRGLEPQPNRSSALVLARARSLGLAATYLRDPGWSDHAELTRGGLPATWIQWREDRCWHSPCDRAARVDPRRLTATARLTISSVRAALSGR
jgi:aminopeptidase YwaD